MEKIEVDQTDEKILNSLRSDARLSYRQVGKNCGVSAATAMIRIKKLEKSGVIEGYTVRINHEKLGYDLTAITELTMAKGENRLLKVEKEISNYPGVCALYNITGSADGLVVAKFKNRRELSSFTRKTLSIDFVERTNTHIVLSTLKEDMNAL
jgi:DNA-binding Lrp family transcriptional regulator